MQLRRGLKWLAVLTVVGMLLILLGGALVTKTDSGAGCGDSWPLCHDQLIPSEFTKETVIELSHGLFPESLEYQLLFYLYGLGKQLDIKEKQNF